MYSHHLIASPPLTNEMQLNIYPLDKIYLVHATDFYPMDQEIKTLAQREANVKDLPLQFRPTIHFSIGGIMQSPLNVKVRRYIIVLPLISVLHVVINLSTVDTAVIGNICLNNSAAIFIKRGDENANNKDSLEKVIYDPNTEDIHELIRYYIHRKGGICIEAKSHGSGPEAFATSNCIYASNEIFNTTALYNSLKMTLPYLSMGTHYNSEFGSFWHFGLLDYMVMEILRRRKKLPKLELQFWTSLIDYAIHRCDNFIKTNFLDCPNIVDTYRYHRKNLLQAIPLFNKLLADPLSHSLLIDSCSFAYPCQMKDYLSNLSVTELDNFIQKNQLSALYQHKLLMQGYYVKRWLLIGTARARSEQIPTLLQQSLYSHGNPDNIAKLFSELSFFLDTTCNRHLIALEILNHIQNQQYPNLHALIRAHPEFPVLSSPKRRIKFIMDRLHEQNIILPDNIGNILTFIDKIAPHTITTLSQFNRNTYISFNEARNDANTLKMLLSFIVDAVRDCVTPLRNITIRDNIPWGTRMNLFESYKQKNNSHWIEDIWNIFGLKECFRQLFFSDKEFCNSSLSLYQMYTTLQNLALKNSVNENQPVSRHYSLSG